MPADQDWLNFSMVVFETPTATRERVTQFCKEFNGVRCASFEKADKQVKRNHYHIYVNMDSPMTDRNLRARLKEWFKTDNPTEKNTHWYSLRVWGDYKKTYNAEQYCFKGLREPTEEETQAWLESGVLSTSEGAPMCIYNKMEALDGYVAKPAFEHWSNYWTQQKVVVKEMERIAADKNAEKNIQIQKIIALAYAQFGHDPGLYKPNEVLYFVFKQFAGSRDDKTVFLTAQRVMFKMDEEGTTRDAVLRIHNKFFL